MRSVDDADIYVVGECAQHRGEVYGLVAPLWEQAEVLADHITGSELEGRLPRFAGGDQAQGRRRRRGVDGRQGARERPTTSSSSTPSPSAASTRPSSSGTASWSAQRWSATCKKVVVPDPGVRQRAAAARGARRADVRHRTPDARSGRRPRWPTDAQVCNCNGVSKGALVACVRGGDDLGVRVMAATKAGKGCGACKQLVTQVVEWAAGGAVDDGSDRESGTCPGSRMTNRR